MTDMTRYVGGFGISPCGHTQAGGVTSDVEPRFMSSRPVDRQRNVSRSQVLRFLVYCYSSWTEIPDVVVRVSEDGGLTFAPAFGPSGFVAPYDGHASNITRYKGHSLVIYIHKTALWPFAEKVVIEYEGVDEYGNSATRTAVRWW